jgi:hypothetical protein
MRSDSDLHETRTNAEQSETAADLRVSFESPMRPKELAMPNEVKLLPCGRVAR